MPYGGGEEDVGVPKIEIIQPLSGKQGGDGGRREKAPSNSGQGRQYLATIIVCLLAFSFGNSVGWLSPALPLLTSVDSPVGRLALEQTSWLGSLTFVGGIVGSFVWGRVADAWGRKLGGYAVTAPFIIGWAMVAFSGSPVELYVARFLTGFAGSGSLIVCPLYISEIAHDSVRGQLGSYVILFMNAGIVAAYALGSVLNYKMFGIVLWAVPVVFLLLFYWLPETPTYLNGKSKRDKSEKSLLWFRGGDVKRVEEEMALFGKISENHKNPGYGALIKTRGRRKAMIIGLGLFSWQQFCGILALLSFVSLIFEQSGSSMSASKSAIMVGLFQLAASYVSSVIVDRSGRKILLLISYMCMGLSLTVIGVYFYLKDHGTGVSTIGWLPVACLCLHVVTYAVGAGPVPYVVVSEILDPEIRGLAQSIFILWGTSLAFISVQIFPWLISVAGQCGNFWFFALWCYVGFVFTWALVPETKGIPLPDILASLNGGDVNSVMQ